MAGSRVHKYFSIFKRVNGLIKSGALRYEDRPLWYDVYAAFPPRIEPIFTREAPVHNVRHLVYAEDEWRAAFVQRFAEPEFVDLEGNKSGTLSVAERFVHKCEHIVAQQRATGAGDVSISKGSSPEWKEAVVNEALSQLRSEGVTLKTRDQERAEEAERLKNAMARKRQAVAPQPHPGS